MRNRKALFLDRSINLLNVKYVTNKKDKKKKNKIKSRLAIDTR